MDYWNRLILASIIGTGVGLGISHFFGNPIIWVGFSLAASIATESSLRTIKNVKAPPNPIVDNMPKDKVDTEKSALKKPLKPNF